MRKSDINCECPNHDCGPVCQQMVFVAQTLAGEVSRKEAAIRSLTKKNGGVQVAGKN